MPDIISKVKSEITEELSERSRISSKNQPTIIEEPIYYKAPEAKPQEEKEKSTKFDTSRRSRKWEKRLMPVKLIGGEEILV